MDLGGYRIDIEAAVGAVKAADARLVALQLPEGLRPFASELVHTLEHRTSATVAVSADPCFGACDLNAEHLSSLGVQLLLHVGHTQIPGPVCGRIPVVYLEALSGADPTAAVTKAIPALVGTRIGLTTTAQHLHVLPTVRRLLEEHGLQPVVSKGSGRTSSEGQILGCDFSAATAIQESVDAFLFIGSGTFHPIGLALATKKQVVAADPYTGEILTDDLARLKDRLLRQRYAAIATAQAASSIGIIVGLKQGQRRLDLARALRSLCERHHRTSVLLILDLLSPSVLQGFPDLGCFVSTACPRIAIDDAALYAKPLLTPPELEVAFGVRRWEDYTFDQILTGL